MSCQSLALARKAVLSIVIWVSGLSTSVFAEQPRLVLRKEVSPQKQHIFSARFGSTNKSLYVAGGSMNEGWIELFTGDEFKTSILRMCHTSYVYCMDIPKNGRVVVTGGRDTNVLVHDPELRGNVITMAGHKGAVYDVSVNETGTVAVSGSEDSTIGVWDLGTGSRTMTLKGHAGAVQAVAISDNATRVLSGGEDRRVLLWPLAGDPSPVALCNFSGRVIDLGASGPAGIIGVSGNSNEFIIWDTEKNRAIVNGAAKNIAFRRNAVSPDGGLAAVSINNGIELWDIAKNTRCYVNESAHRNLITHLSFSDDGSMLVSSGWGKQVVLWDVRR